MSSLFSGSASPWRFKANLRPGSVHPLDGIPLEVAGQVADVVACPIVHYFTHFNDYTGPLAEGTAGEWTLVGTTGTSVVALDSTVEDGVITISTSGTENDNAVLALFGQVVNNTPTSNIWVAAKFSLSDADDMEAYFGLARATVDWANALPFAGFFFEKAETATNWDFHVRDAGASTENTADFEGLVIADNTDMILAIRVSDGDVTPYVHTDANGWITGTTVPSTDANQPISSEDLILQYAFETGAAAVRSVSTDWALVAREIPNG